MQNQLLHGVPRIGCGCCRNAFKQRPLPAKKVKAESINHDKGPLRSNAKSIWMPFLTSAKGIQYAFDSPQVAFWALNKLIRVAIALNCEVSSFRLLSVDLNL
jgi:hypothetical protein